LKAFIKFYRINQQQDICNYKVYYQRFYRNESLIEVKPYKKTQVPI